MEDSLMARLSAITQEEARILSGEGLHPEDYTVDPGFMIDSGHLMASGQLITLRPHTRFTAFPRHTHNYIEIMYQLSGQTVHLIDDRDRVTLKSGELLLMNQHAAHAIERADAPDVAVNMIVMPAFFQEVLPQLSDDSAISRFLVAGLTERDEGMSSLLFHVADVPAIQYLLRSMIADLLRPAPVSRRIASTAMALLFLQLIDHTETLDGDSLPCQREHALVLAALREVQERYPSANLTAVAEKYGASVSYICRLIRSTTGQTFTELVQAKRLARAKELLARTTLTVAEILPLIGYNNSSYFYRIFEESEHMSPRQYRLAHSGGSVRTDRLQKR